MYYLGVDGGNTKTDFALMRADGTLIDWIRVGTCSHEALPGGYAAAAQALAHWVEPLCCRNAIHPEQIEDAVLGLAGADTDAQRRALENATASLPLRKKLIVNDSFLSIKAASTSGYGICSINGTGTVVGGIDERGAMLQVGGIGRAAGDFYGGGSSFAESAISAVYNTLMRCGAPTAMTEPVLELLRCEAPEKLMDSISEWEKRLPVVALMQILFQAANAGDAVAGQIVQEKALGLADSVLGCMERLCFTKQVTIITAGTVWVKAESPMLFECFRKQIEARAKRKCVFVQLELPPVCGALNWAHQRAGRLDPMLRVKTNACFKDSSCCRKISA